MNIFNSKQLEQQSAQIAQLTQQLTTLTAKLQAVTVEREALSRDLRQVRLERTTAQDAAKTAQAALAEFETSLHASLEQLGCLLKIDSARWVDPTAIWHLSIEHEGESYWLQLNNTPVLRGHSRQELLSIVNQIAAVKAKATQR